MVELTISKMEIEDLIQEKYDMEEITEKQRDEALNDLKLGDYTEWIENGFIMIELDFSKVTVDQYVGECNENLSVFVVD